MSDEYKHLKQWGRRATFAFCLIVLCVAVGFWRITVNENNKAEAGTYGNCHRTNIQRATDNKNFYNSYVAFDLLSKLAFNHNNDIIFKNKYLVDAFINVIEESADNDMWIPLTNCKQAVENPYHYIPPSPIRFSQQTPSKYAFELGPSN